MCKQIRVLVGFTSLAGAMGLTLVPHATAQINNKEFQMRCARKACTIQAQQQFLTVNGPISATLRVPNNINGTCQVTVFDARVNSIATPVLAQQLPHKTQLIQIAQTSPSIEGNWRLANISEDAAPTPMLLSQELTADFSGDRLSGSGGCNRFMGGFKTQGNQLTIDPLTSTFKACETPYMDQEAKYLKALQGAQRYEVNDQGLQIFYQTAQGSGVLRFTSQPIRALW